MAEERITLRMGTEEVQAMDAYLDEHPELGNRSQFIRTAVREYVNRDADVAALSDKSDKGLFVQFTEAELATMATMAETGLVLNEQEFVRKAVSVAIGTDKVLAERAQAAYAFETSEMLKK